jgi:hypothetical protein
MTKSSMNPRSDDSEMTDTVSITVPRKLFEDLSEVGRAASDGKAKQPATYAAATLLRRHVNRYPSAYKWGKDRPLTYVGDGEESGSQ